MIPVSKTLRSIEATYHQDGGTSWFTYKLNGEDAGFFSNAWVTLVDDYGMNSDRADAALWAVSVLPTADSPEASTTTVTEAIDAFLDLANNHPQTPHGYTFEAERLTKRTRIVMVARGGGRSAHAFVDNETGDLLKAAGWATPAKHVRFNLLNDMTTISDRFDWAGGYLYLR